MKSIIHLHFGLQKLAVRLFGGVSTRADKQRGVSALEYIMLAAVIVGLLVGLATVYDGNGNNPIVNFFNDLFDTAENPTGS